MTKPFWLKPFGLKEHCFRVFRGFWFTVLLCCARSGSLLKVFRGPRPQAAQLRQAQRMTSAIVQPKRPEDQRQGGATVLLEVFATKCRRSDHGGVQTKFRQTLALALRSWRKRSRSSATQIRQYLVFKRNCSRLSPRPQVPLVQERTNSTARPSTSTRQAFPQAKRCR